MLRRRHDDRSLDRVPEPPVGHLQHDRVALAQRVDVAERCEDRSCDGRPHRRFLARRAARCRRSGPGPSPAAPDSLLRRTRTSRRCSGCAAGRAGRRCRCAADAAPRTPRARCSRGLRFTVNAAGADSAADSALRSSALSWSCWRDADHALKGSCHATVTIASAISSRPVTSSTTAAAVRAPSRVATRARHARTLRGDRVGCQETSRERCFRRKQRRLGQCIHSPSFPIALPRRGDAGGGDPPRPCRPITTRYACAGTAAGIPRHRPLRSAGALRCSRLCWRARRAGCPARTDRCPTPRRCRSARTPVRRRPGRRHRRRPGRLPGPGRRSHSRPGP